MKSFRRMVFVLELVIFAGIGWQMVSAQSRLDDKDLQHILENLSSDAKSFRSTFDQALKQSSIRKTSRQKDAENLAMTFQKQTAGIADQFKHTKKVPGLEVVSATAGQIELLISELQLSGETTVKWQKIKQELAQVESAFDLSPTPPPARSSNAQSSSLGRQQIGTVTAQDNPTGVTLKFQNQRPNAATVPAFITFGGGGQLTGTNLADNTPLVKGTSYPLNSLASGVNITTFDDGRIFLSLGTGLTSAKASNGYSPNFANPDPNVGDFTTRWDKIELTIGPSPTGTTGGINLTSQDFFGLPLDVVTSGGSKTPAHLTWNADTATVFTKLGVLSNYAVITNENATGALGIGNNGITVNGIQNVIRVISPGSVSPTTADGKTVYPNLAGYVSYLQTGNSGQPVQTQIAGHNGQIPNGDPDGGPFQTYNLIATVSNSSYTVNGTSISPGDLVFTGPINSGNGAVNYTILVPAKYLSDTAIYGANPGWCILVPAGPPCQYPPIPNPATDLNKIVEKVTADYFAALNFGFAGSTVNNANQNGTAIGASPSWTWYGNNLSGQAAPKLSIKAAFNAAQPDTTKPYFNQYADYLVGVTDSYGFAYNDRLELPLAPVSDGATVVVSILPDSR